MNGTRAIQAWRTSLLLLPPPGPLTTLCVTQVSSSLFRFSVLVLTATIVRHPGTSARHPGAGLAAQVLAVLQVAAGMSARLNAKMIIAE
jgi:hypothetical protein